MNYSLILRDAISKSGLKLNEIAERVEQKIGVRPDIAYLSRLQNNKISPASDKMNEALEEVLGINRAELLTAAYREKIPVEVLRKLGCEQQKANESA